MISRDRWVTTHVLCVMGKVEISIITCRKGNEENWDVNEIDDDPRFSETEEILYDFVFSEETFRLVTTLIRLKIRNGIFRMRIFILWCIHIYLFKYDMKISLYALESVTQFFRCENFSFYDSVSLFECHQKGENLLFNFRFHNNHEKL